MYSLAFFLKKLVGVVLVIAVSIATQITTADEGTGLRGDPVAIAHARAMVEEMGGGDQQCRPIIGRDTACKKSCHQSARSRITI